MNENQFVYWLQGFVELNPQAMLTLTQWQIVKDHLALVFKKETPDRLEDHRRIPLPVSPRPAEPFPAYPGYPSDRLLTPFKQPAWMNPNIQWPPGTIIC
jgi:hypothetical protein